ncbi:UDP-glycosyltransferase 87A1-like [Olea europaea var. sylvestris]|uniref:UDP-glycosyltransferase 87A1-like n=1 Tax=Olea europaea var. sylvestris TaxID=158386 RepID=UPI000C1D80F4|nr:UDP-glycosyltransferase 87A1-like [Olea europaea var. sylvestris]
MASERTEPITSRHMVVIPYPGRGHINAMMNLCKMLTAASPNHNLKLLITFVITEEWLDLIGLEEKPLNINFATIPNILPSELGRAADKVGFVGATQTKIEEPFEKLLDRLQSPVHIIVADTFLNWSIEVGNRRNIPVASYWTMPSLVFSSFYYFDLIVQNGHFPFELSERGEERIDYIPGISSIRLADLPSLYCEKDQRLLHLALQVFSNVSKAQYLLFTSIFELEPQVINALKREFLYPVYSLGPMVPYFNPEKTSRYTTTKNDPHYLQWLSSQPPNSVLYVSLGSFLTVSSAQMDEIAGGLEESGVRYLWVAREDAARFKEKCNIRGMILPWCEQLKVLCHSSVGGFWTHCGWNSTIEGIFAGQPLLTLPIQMDQTTIRKFIVEDWKTGWDVKKEAGGGDLLRRDEIAKLVKRFMDLESKERREMSSRARELQEICHRAIAEGGSSKMNLDAFLDNILGH